MAIRIFGDIDRQRDGTIRSFTPAWALKQSCDNLAEEVESTKRQLDAGLIPPSEIPYANERVKKGEERIREINDSKPKLNSEQRDWLAKEREKVADQISNTMFTHSDMEMGYADPHQELAKWMEPTIALDPEQAKESGITLVDGKTGLKAANKYYQHISKVLGEDSNPERLRRSGKTVRSEMPTQEFPGHDRRLPEHYSPEEKIPEIKPNSTFEHKGIEVKVNKGGRPKGSKNKRKKKV